MLKPTLFKKIEQPAYHRFRFLTIMMLKTLDKNDRKYLLWFLISLAIAILPWIILA